VTAQPAVVEGMRAYCARRAATCERVYAQPERQADLRAMAAWLATDLNPETMAVARTKLLPACVQFATVDAYSMAELGSWTFDAAFTGCWWSHVPLQTLPAWLATLHARLPPGARTGQRVAGPAGATPTMAGLGPLLGLEL